MPSEQGPAGIVPPGSPQGNNPPFVKDTHDDPDLCGAADEPPRELASHQARRAGCTGHSQPCGLRLRPDECRRTCWRSRAGSSAGASGLACPEGKLSAEGSSAQANAINEAIANYNAECGDKATIEYNPTGSGAGIKSFYNGLVDFAGSDSVLKTESSDGVVEADKARNAVRTTRLGTCLWWLARSPSRTTSMASTSWC